MLYGASSVEKLETVGHNAPCTKTQNVSSNDEYYPVTSHTRGRPLFTFQSFPLMKRKQVRSACSNCRFKHARCDNERPCGGCVKAGLAESCVDAPRKQRKHNEEHSASSNGAYNYLTLFDVRDSCKTAEKSSLYSLSSFNAPTDSLVRISNFTEDPIPKITTLDTNKIYDATGPTDIQLPVGASNFTYYSYEPSLGMPPNQRNTHPLNTYVVKSGFPISTDPFIGPGGHSSVPVMSNVPYMVGAYPPPPHCDTRRASFSGMQQLPPSPTQQITQNNKPISLNHINLRQPIKSPATSTDMTTSAPELFSPSKPNSNNNQDKINNNSAPFPLNPPPPNKQANTIQIKTSDSPTSESPNLNDSDTKSSPSFDELVDPDINFSIDFGANPLSLKSSFRSDRAPLWAYDDSSLTNELRRSQELLSSYNFASPLRRSFAFGGLKESFDAFPLRTSMDFKTNLSDSFIFDPPNHTDMLSMFDEPYTGNNSLQQSFNDFDNTQIRQLG